MTLRPADQEERAHVARLRVLRGCTEAISRSLRRGGSVLFSAKVLVLSRRLHRGLFEHPKTLKYVEGLRVKLGKLRQKLLEIIDRRLAMETVDTESLLDTMCAFALATSSSCADVFRHFHFVRASAVSSQFEGNESRGAAIQASLIMLTRTLRETRSVFPRQISKALAQLKEQPLLQDEGVRASPELDLDLHGVWIDKETKHFFPYIRHDDLQIASAAQQLSTWAASTLKRLLEDIQSSLEGIDEVKMIVELRHETIQLWLSHSNNLHGVNKKQILNQLRSAFQTRLCKLLEERCRSVEDVGDFITNCAEDSTKLEAECRALPGLWNTSVVSIDLSDGAEPFINAVDASYLGRIPSLAQTASRFSKWLKDIGDLRSVLSGMAKSRWEDEDDFDDALSTDSDEDASITAQTLLCVQDPKALAQQLDSTLKSALEAFSEGFSLSDTAPSPMAALKAAYLLRALRIITNCLPSSGTSLPVLHSHHHVSSGQPPNPLNPLLANFLALASPLYHIISTSLVHTFVARHQALLKRLVVPEGSISSHDLWDGEPPLPTLPSPSAFRLLKDLHTALEAAGSDLWSVAAVRTLSESLQRRLAEALAEASTAEESGREAAIQRLFDLELWRAITASATEARELEKLREEWVGKLNTSQTGKDGESLDVPKKLQQNAAMYWARSRLLFGLLSPSSKGSK